MNTNSKNSGINTNVLSTNGCPKGSINKIHGGIMLFQPVTYIQNIMFKIHIKYYTLDGSNEMYRAAMYM